MKPLLSERQLHLVYFTSLKLKSSAVMVISMFTFRQWGTIWFRSVEENSRREGNRALDNTYLPSSGEPHRILEPWSQKATSRSSSVKWQVGSASWWDSISLRQRVNRVTGFLQLSSSLDGRSNRLATRI